MNLPDNTRLGKIRLATVNTETFVDFNMLQSEMMLKGKFALIN